MNRYGGSVKRKKQEKRRAINNRIEWLISSIVTLKLFFIFVSKDRLALQTPSKAYLIQSIIIII